MTMKRKETPPLYRLTLSRPAFNVFASIVKHIYVVFERKDGKLEVGIPLNLADQLQTAALPKENLSDTVLRVMRPRQGVK